MTRGFYRGAAVLAAAEVLVRLKAFAVIPLLTRRLGPSGYGVWAQVAVVAIVLGPLVMLGTDSGIVRYLPGTDRERRSRQFAGWVIAVGATGVVVCAVVAVLRRPLAVVVFGSAGEYARFVPLAAGSVMTSILISFARTWYRLENDAVRLSMVTVAQAVLSVVALVVWYVLGQSLFALVGYSVAADSVLGILVLVGIGFRMGWIRPDFSLLTKLARYGVVLLPAGYAVWALNWADRLFLVHYANLRAVGIYSLAYSLGYTVIQVVVNPIWTMFPNTASALWNQGRISEAQRLFESTAGVILALTAPVIAGGVVLGGGLLRLLAPADFAHASLVMPLVLAGYLFFLLSAFYEVVFGLVDRQGLGAVTVGSACAVNVLLNFLLVPRYSYYGAAVATVASFALELVLCLGLARHLRTLTTPLVMPLRIAAASTAMAVLLLPFRHFFLAHGGLGLLGGTAAGTVIYALLCLALRIVRPASVITEARRLFGGRRAASAAARAVGSTE